MLLLLLLIILLNFAKGYMDLIGNTGMIVFNFDVNLYSKEIPVGAIGISHECYNISAATFSGTNQYMEITYTTDSFTHW